jgi:hypothetical protein
VPRASKNWSLVVRRDLKLSDVMISSAYIDNLLQTVGEMLVGMILIGGLRTCPMDGLQCNKPSHFLANNSIILCECMNNFKMKGTVYNETVWHNHY